LIHAEKQRPVPLLSNHTAGAPAEIALFNSRLLRQTSAPHPMGLPIAHKQKNKRE
jgi:hypothetical protein